MKNGLNSYNDNRETNNSYESGALTVGRDPRSSTCLEAPMYYPATYDKT